MARKPSLAPELYTNASAKIDDLYRLQMREQDLGPEVTDSKKPRFTIVVGPSPFSMPRGTRWRRATTCLCISVPCRCR